MAFEAAYWRESDRVIGPMKPGNAGGGKDPDFWCAFEDGEVKVIGEVVACKSSGVVVTVFMAWSPAWRSNAK
jgi:hypothetical protein